MGIGTNFPSSSLEIKADSTPTIQLTDENGTSDYKSYIQLGGNDMRIRGSSGTMQFYTGAVDGLSSTLAMSISSGGAATFVSTVTATNFITTSDKRLKSNIIPIKEGLETLKKFVSYEYIKDKKQDAGFIAQEVKEIIPYSVFENSDGYLTMNDRPILAHMHKAIIELDKRLSAIEEELK